MAVALFLWVLQEHGGFAMVESAASRVGARWPLLLVPWAIGVWLRILSYKICLPARGKDLPTSILVRVQLAGSALNRLLPLGASSSNILKVGLLRHWYTAEALVAAGIWGSLGTGIANVVGALGPLCALFVGFGEPWLVASLVLVNVLMGIPALTAVFFVARGLSERATRVLTFLPLQSLQLHRQAVLDWAARLDVHLAAAVGDRREDFRLLLVMRVVSMGVRVLEIWLAVELLGIEGGLLIALLYNSMSRSVTQLIRFIPGRLGVMEMSASAMFLALGLAPEEGLALALALRVRYLAGLLLSFGALSTVHDLPEQYPPRTEQQRADGQQSSSA